MISIEISNIPARRQKKEYIRTGIAAARTSPGMLWDAVNSIDAGVVGGCSL